MPYDRAPLSSHEATKMNDSGSSDGTSKAGYVLIRHHIADYAKWEPVFVEHGPTRRSAGSRGSRVFRNPDDPEEIVILLEFDDLDRARDLTESDDTRAVMQRAGVTDKPDIHYLEEVGRFAE